MYIDSWHCGCFLRDGERGFADKLGGEKNVIPKVKNYSLGTVLLVVDDMWKLRDDHTVFWDFNLIWCF